MATAPAEPRYRILAPCHHHSFDAGDMRPLYHFTANAKFETDGSGTWQEKKTASEKAIIERLLDLGVISLETEVEAPAPAPAPPADAPVTSPVTPAAGT